jgi:hypothetical protein
MPKPNRTTADPLGNKLLQILREKGHEDDLVYLAGEFGVEVQSTYDWIKHGRIAKSRYARLVEWSGRTLHWWFDIPVGVDSPGGVLRAAEPSPAWRAPDWPLKGVTPDDWHNKLSAEMRGEVIGYVKGLLRANQEPRLANGTAG